ncbi:MAG: hypothetical protein ACRCT8_03395 [Lacipirellulaceae bacterium]
MSHFRVEHTMGIGLDAPAPRGGASRHVEAPHLTRVVASWTAMVLSIDDARRRRLSEAAASAGWRTIDCRSVSEAGQVAQRWRTQLAVIDLGAAERDGDGAAGDERSKLALRRLAERLAEASGPLLMVCDDDPDAAAELWAREVGVWLYLPEATLGEDITALCSEAMAIAEKLHRGGIVAVGI